MKKQILAIAALTLTVGLVGCKKTEAPIMTEPEIVQPQPTETTPIETKPTAETETQPAVQEDNEKEKVVIRPHIVKIGDMPGFEEYAFENEGDGNYNATLYYLTDDLVEADIREMLFYRPEELEKIQQGDYIEAADKEYEVESVEVEKTEDDGNNQVYM